MMVGMLPRWRLVRTVEAFTLPEKVGSVFGFSGQNVPCFIKIIITIVFKVFRREREKKERK